MKFFRTKNAVLKNALAVALLLLCAVPGFAGDRKQAAVDPDDAYKNNCTRCHSEVRAYSPRMTATIVNHMRVRANLTAEEADAILQYLTDNAPTREKPAESAKRSLGRNGPGKDEPKRD